MKSLESLKSQYILKVASFLFAYFRYVGPGINISTANVKLIENSGTLLETYVGILCPCDSKEVKLDVVIFPEMLRVVSV